MCKVSTRQIKPEIPVKSIATLVLIGVIIGPGIYGCGYTASTGPTPTITTISPNSAVAGGAAFTLTINGANFGAGSMVNFGGAAPATTFVSATQLTAAVPATAISSAGTVAVTVTNPAPGGGTSNAVSFTVGTNPVPTIIALSPSGVIVGGPDFTLTVFGSNFVPSSVVRWNGSDRPTRVVTGLNGSQLTAQISASDMAATGTAVVTVFNPAPGGGSSNTSTFTIDPACPRSVAVDPTGKFVYVANSGCGDQVVGNVSMYTINPTTGSLTSVGTPVAADFCTNSVTVDPFGKFAYVANQGCGDNTGDVSMYTINATTGVLTSIGTIAAVCGPPNFSFLCIAPNSVAVHPSGKFAYVANSGNGSAGNVSMYTINATTGALTSIGTIPAGVFPTSIAIEPSGKFAYVTDSGSNDPRAEPEPSVLTYTINATTGVLTSTGTIGTGLAPTSITIDPSGKFAYVPNSGSSDISMYTINATTGALTSIGPIAVGVSPGLIAIDPSGKLAYVTGSNNVAMYTINATTGALTFKGTTAAGLPARAIAIDPSGKFAYVTGSNNVAMYTIDAATGAFTIIGTIGT